MPRCLPSAKAWFAQCALPSTRVPPGGMLKVSPCQWNGSNASSAPNHSRATALSATSTLPQPISLTRVRVTSPPSAFDISCPPRQCPSVGTSLRSASRTSSSAGLSQGRPSSLTLIGPPMKASPANLRTSFGTARPSSSAISLQGIARRSR